MSRRFEDRTAIVTGAARGMGQAVAAALLAEGASVVMLDRDAGGVESAAAALDPDGGRTLARRCDVTSAPTPTRRSPPPWSGSGVWTASSTAPACSAWRRSRS